ncbi:MAG: helix-turn-helix transcriptional regulator [Chloroflexota bacterium]|nr:helix-turn-helix transcriptional regulator [Chloroflexota bacterium]
MANLKDRRLESSLSKAELARRAGVDVGTVTRAEEGQAIQAVKAAAIAKIINQALDLRLSVEDLGIVIYSERH